MIGCSAVEEEENKEHRGERKKGSSEGTPAAAFSSFEKFKPATTNTLRGERAQFRLPLAASLLVKNQSESSRSLSTVSWSVSEVNLLDWSGGPTLDRLSQPVRFIIGFVTRSLLPITYDDPSSLSDEVRCSSLSTHPPFSLSSFLFPLRSLSFVWIRGTSVYELGIKRIKRSGKVFPFRHSRLRSHLRFSAGSKNVDNTPLNVCKGAVLFLESARV
ncbi:hypothetical protein PHSY_003602 [Pseudozyma hubeiensis SY62]|uniref:Uncharacterized protein n=1 Tax=Pseudozyma hubeiensis (strain SY62) TaxID=1305764 RepID=R9P3J6_PSEHS|nr:hypothetical protein PHSY_003602 [Pseudozyma hubeiensis SY62]GAC96023.1 hypothetical protein PHSY_003602 [Pseudozyma hubeiensis SY62]